METVAKRRIAKQKLARRRASKAPVKLVPYSLPEPVILPDWNDEGIFRKYRDAAERRERESRRSRVRNFLYHLMNL
ncbi:hypothetical protein QFZ23_002061 [Arthrobacter globiformis]|nr:hypothetical protein [Arthrobacter globiformis]